SDDASTDGTVAILERYARERGLRYARHSDHSGLVRNFERALRMASGEFIALADQDDIWKPEKIATLMKHLGEFTLIYGTIVDVLTPEGRRGRATELEPINHFMRD